MKVVEKGFWHYFGKWRNIFSRPAPIVARDGWLDNPYCADCRFCCGPQDSPEPFPMALSPAQIAAGAEKDFYMLDDSTACLGAKGCKACGEHGCKLPRARRPLACGIFPIVLANGGLYLYQNCPAVLFTPLEEFYRLGRQVAESLDRLSLEELRHISLDIPIRTLAEKYIDLHIRIFNEDKKELVLS